MDKDEFIELEELEEAMRDTELMCVAGCAWKLYIDPPTSVICYHNFDTDQKILEFDMTDEILREINIANYYAEQLKVSQTKVDDMRMDDLVFRERTYYTRRLQYLYRQWKGRRNRSGAAWKLARASDLDRRVYQKKMVQFCEVYFKSTKSRARFRRELHCSIEKVWDINEGRMFWYNHVTKVSTWDEPLLLKRYGDVESPYPWIVSTVQKEVSVDGGGTEWQERLSYWHASARKEMSRKPDGVFMCEHCHVTIALRQCRICQIKYCFGCHRETHSSAVGFLQAPEITRAMKSDPVFLEKLQLMSHDWSKVLPIHCEKCGTTKIMASHRCFDCAGNKMIISKSKERKEFVDYCRPCFKRVHDDENFAEHKFNIF